MRGLLFGTIALVGAVLSQRTIGGFIVAVVSIIALSQLSGLSPSMALNLPLLHIENLSAHWLGDADALSQLETAFGQPVRTGFSALNLLCWVLALLGLALYRLRRLDIRGGGD